MLSIGISLEFGGLKEGRGISWSWIVDNAVTEGLDNFYPGPVTGRAAAESLREEGRKERTRSHAGCLRTERAAQFCSERCLHRHQDRWCLGFVCFQKPSGPWRT